MIKKLITFCVFGDNIIYKIGAIKNAILAQQIYPDWICRFYLFSECFDLKKELDTFQNVETVLIEKKGGFYSTLYRFLPLEEENVSYFISRDTDSRLSFREKEAVDEWIDSNKTYHIMKDHPYHYTPEFPILAGMWGAKGGIKKDIRPFIKNFCENQNDNKGIDQKLLYCFFHTNVGNDCIVHESHNFPSQRNYERDKLYYVGQPFDENDNFYGNWKNDLQKIGINYE